MPGDPSWHERRYKRALKSQPVVGLYTFLINKGRGFSTPVRVTDIGNGDSVYVVVKNPSDSGFAYDIVMLPRATGQADIDVSVNGTENDASNGTVNNLKAGSSRTFSGTVTTFDDSTDTGTAPTHGDFVIQDFVPGGGSGAPDVSAQVIDSIATTIPEGDNKIFELANESGGTLSRMSLNLTIFEVDGTYKELN